MSLFCLTGILACFEFIPLHPRLVYNYFAFLYHLTGFEAQLAPHGRVKRISDNTLTRPSIDLSVACQEVAIQSRKGGSAATSLSDGILQSAKYLFP